MNLKKYLTVSNQLPGITQALLREQSVNHVIIGNRAREQGGYDLWRNKRLRIERTLEDVIVPMGGNDGDRGVVETIERKAERGEALGR